MEFVRIKPYFLAMFRIVFLYALILAAAALALDWLEYRFLVRATAPHIVMGLIATCFAGLGLGMGWLLFARGRSSESFIKNDRAIASLGLTRRECEILTLLAEGQSNKEMACAMGVSPNTIKTHLSNLYDKLDVSRRTQAVGKARLLSIVP